MFHYVLKKFNYFKMLSQNTYKQKVGDKNWPETKLTSSLVQNLSILKDIWGTSDDIIMREFSFGDMQKTKACIIFVDGMADKNIINQSIIKPLMYDSRLIKFKKQFTDIHLIETAMLSVGEVEKTDSINKIVDSCLSGNTLLIIDGFTEALVIGTKRWESRGINEPKTEVVVRGPHEGFTETLRTNTVMLRRKTHDPNFTLETMKIGETTKTSVSIAYMKGIVNPLLVEEVKRRLRRIKIDAILESGYIEQFIEDAPFSIFATVANSEKPDVVAAKILEGRIAILVDGTPIVLTVPMLFIESFQSAEDYYSRPYFASIIRALRYVSFLISFLAPATYVALVTFRQEIIPTPLLITMAAAREGIPFPAVLEALIMIITFEILREAGVRLPRSIGQAISIVGALVIGEASVDAGLISAPMVIVVAITAISSFVSTAQSDSISILRIVFIVLAGFMGIFGITIGILGLLIHLSSLRSFGTPYFSPISPFSPGGMKDTFIRLPMWAMYTRPKTIGWRDPKREEFRLRPETFPDKE